MLYKSLDELIEQSKSSRSWFLSLPADMQMRLHELNGQIHSAHDLHEQKRLLDCVLRRERIFKSK